VGCQAEAEEEPPVKALLVDDDPEFLAMLQLGLAEVGVAWKAVGSAERALATLAAAAPDAFDVLLLDVHMPGRTGWELLEELRAAGNQTPAIFLTGAQDVDDRVRGLRLGADDYLVKPFAFPELLARIESVLRRRSTLAPLIQGDVRLDLVQRRVTRGGHLVSLSPREFDLLTVLMRAKGGVVPREHLLRQVWGMDFDPGTNLLDVHIGRLRRKVDRHGPPLIYNERGIGFRLRSDADPS
jgi:DNA-binding response OmpR family regulator